MLKQSALEVRRKFDRLRIRPPLPPRQIPPGLPIHLHRYRPGQTQLSRRLYDPFRRNSQKTYLGVAFSAVQVRQTSSSLYYLKCSSCKLGQILYVHPAVQIVQNCPDSFLENEDFAYSTMELCSAYLLKILLSTGAMKPDKGICEDSISLLLKIAKTLMMRFEPKKQLKWVLAVLLIGYKCLKRASTEQCFSQVNNFIQSTFSLLKKQYDGE